MINATFDVAIDTPKYHKRGTIALKSEGERITATMNVGEVRGLTLEGTCKDKDFTFSGEEEFADMGRISFEAKGNTWGNSISATCETSIGKVTVFGTRISAAAGEFVSSHEYMMAAAAGDFDGAGNTMYSGLYGDAD